MSARAITIWNGISQRSRDVIEHRHNNNTPPLQEALNLCSWDTFISVGWIWSDDEHSLWYEASGSSSISEIERLIEPLHFTHAKNMWAALPQHVRQHMIDIGDFRFLDVLDSATWDGLCISWFSFSSYAYMANAYRATTPAEVIRIIEQNQSPVSRPEYDPTPVSLPPPPPPKPKERKVVYDIMDRKGLIYQFCIDMAVTRNPETEEYIQQWIKQKEL